MVGLNEIMNLSMGAIVFVKNAYLHVGPLEMSYKHIGFPRLI